MPNAFSRARSASRAPTLRASNLIRHRRRGHAVIVGSPKGWVLVRSESLHEAIRSPQLAAGAGEAFPASRKTGVIVRYFLNFRRVEASKNCRVSFDTISAAEKRSSYRAIGPQFPCRKMWVYRSSANRSPADRLNRGAAAGAMFGSIWHRCYAPAARPPRRPEFAHHCGPRSNRPEFRGLH